MKETKAQMKYRLENEIAGLYGEMQTMRDYYHRKIKEIKEDPTYWNAGEYTFATAYKDRYFRVTIMNRTVNLYELHKDHHTILMQVPTYLAYEKRK